MDFSETGGQKTQENFEHSRRLPMESLDRRTAGWKLDMWCFTKNPDPSKMADTCYIQDHSPFHWRVLANSIGLGVQKHVKNLPLGELTYPAWWRGTSSWNVAWWWTRKFTAKISTIAGNYCPNFSSYFFWGGWKNKYRNVSHSPNQEDSSRIPLETKTFLGHWETPVPTF